LCNTFQLALLCSVHRSCHDRSTRRRHKEHCQTGEESQNYFSIEIVHKISVFNESDRTNTLNSDYKSNMSCDCDVTQRQCTVDTGNYLNYMFVNLTVDKLILQYRNDTVRSEQCCVSCRIRTFFVGSGRLGPDPDPGLNKWPYINFFAAC
jgi:hypothetical protein